MASRPESAGVEWRRRYAQMVADEIAELEKAVGLLTKERLRLETSADVARIEQVTRELDLKTVRLKKLRATGLSDKAKSALARLDPQLYEQFHLDPHYPAPSH